jgi:Fe-S-cluster containining protein
MHAEPDARMIFACTRCGECCRGFGGTFVTQDDIRRIAAHIRRDPVQVQQTMCQPAGRGWVLAQAPNGFCIFWDKLCTIHPVKPRMCRRWPFIEAVLVDIVNWHSMGASCPGIRTDAPEALIHHIVMREIQREQAQ